MRPAKRPAVVGRDGTGCRRWAGRRT